MQMEIVLIEPEIPQNTGSIARTCAATGTPLHLVGPLGFEITEKRVRRAGLDYWPYVSVFQHASWEEYLQKNSPQRVWFLSKYAAKPYYQADFAENDALVFGSETKGLGKEFLAKIPAEQQLLIPMLCPQVRSLNLSNAVAIVLYEALKQAGKL
jgi:tRNA (cytidine/uridine-2'-O-)-methyltransferase